MLAVRLNCRLTLCTIDRVNGSPRKSFQASYQVHRHHYWKAAVDEYHQRCDSIPSLKYPKVYMALQHDFYYSIKNLITSVPAHVLT